MDYTGYAVELANATTIGIDLGTSNTRAAYFNGSVPAYLQSSYNTPSFVSWNGNRFAAGIIGNPLSFDDEIQSGAAVFNTKRLIGRVEPDPVLAASKSVPFLVQSFGVKPRIASLVNGMWRYTSPVEALAVLLLEVRLMAEMELRCAVRRVVLTVPASFTRHQRSLLQRACSLAGFDRFRDIPEPVAVGIWYAYKQRFSVDKTALIFSMGGGYCDVAIISVHEGIPKLKVLSGIPMGGEDLLQNTMRHLLPEYDTLFPTCEIGKTKAMALLRRATETAIHVLSDEDTAEVNVDLGNGIKVSKTLDVEEFMNVNMKVFENCWELVVHCLFDARVEAKDLADVVLVGGCSNIRMVRDFMSTITERDVFYERIHPLGAAVCGAAIEGVKCYSYRDPSLLTGNLTSFCISVRADNNNLVTVVPSKSKIPTTIEHIFTTAHDDQTEALVLVYEEKCLLGYIMISGIPEATRGVPQIKVTTSIDLLNRLGVTAQCLLPEAGFKGPVMAVRLPDMEHMNELEADVLNCESLWISSMNMD